jgi:hypothetical protein
MIAVQTTRGTYEGHYRVEPVSPTSGSVGFVAMLKNVGLLGPDNRYTPLPIATELRGRWSGRTKSEAVEGLVQQFESWARSQP